MKEYIRRYFMLRRHNMKVAIKKAKMSKMCYAFLAPYAIILGLSSFLCKFFRKNFMGRGTSPFVELVALKLHLIKVPT